MYRSANVVIFYQPRSAVAIGTESNFIILAVISGDSLVLRARTQGQPAKER
jgi:tRNA threonylcarbamoyladenosine modification (KEOPS) complex  Pcc1 subunit